MLRRLKSLFGRSRLTEDEYQQLQRRILQETPVPVFWLLGKTGSGKTSVVRYLTGAADAEIGNGFAPKTSTSRQYDFPSATNPLLRFLDTRGLGEGQYDPREDLRQFAEMAHLLIVTARALDHALDLLVAPLRKIRAATPQRPVVLVLTCLHEAYPQQQHPAGLDESEIDRGRLPPDLLRSIEAQQHRFGNLVDRVVLVDLTRPEEGFAEPNLGAAALKETLIQLLPAGYRQALLCLDDTLRQLQDLQDRRAMPYVLSYSGMAATAAAVPTPWVDIPAVLAIQSRLVYQLARLYGQEMRAGAVAQVAGALGGRLLVRLALREALKLVPAVGMAANSALAFAYTYGLGKACCWYFGRIGQGYVPTDHELREVWQEQITAAERLWKRHQAPETAS